MNLKRLYEILKETTTSFRKGEIETTKEYKNVTVQEFYIMPHVDEAKDLEMVDVHFMQVGVNRVVAIKNRAELITILDGYEPRPHPLKEGPSYIEVGAVIGDQEAAFRLFALGQVLGFWEVMTPERIGITGEAADDLAGRGLIMITGYKP